MVSVQNQHLWENFCVCDQTTTFVRATARAGMLVDYNGSSDCALMMYNAEHATSTHWYSRCHRRYSWFVTDNVVQGHHVYKDRCTPTIDETLQCLREQGSSVDRFAMGV